MDTLEKPETEDNWDKMERAAIILSSVVRGGAYKLEADFVPGVKSLARALSKAVRTKTITGSWNEFSK